jgi:hypothetical protein
MQVFIKSLKALFLVVVVIPALILFGFFVKQEYDAKIWKQEKAAIVVTVEQGGKANGCNPLTEFAATITNMNDRHLIEYVVVFSYANKTQQIAHGKNYHGKAPVLANNKLELCIPHSIPVKLGDEVEFHQGDVHLFKLV